MLQFAYNFKIHNMKSKIRKRFYDIDLCYVLSICAQTYLTGSAFTKGTCNQAVTHSEMDQLVKGPN